jgi:hypothetical protein
LFGDLERDRLRAFGVVRPKLRVHEPPVELERQLDREPADVIVRALDGIERRAVHRGRDQLLGLEIGGAEHGGLRAALHAELSQQG